MSTITNNKLTDETLKAWKTEAMISLGETPKDCRDYSHHEAILALVTELQELRAAMLQSSQPVSNHDELPYAQVKAVADLYALCWQSGEVVTYTPDPEKATIWLNNYSGTSVQEYVNLERLQEDTKHGLLEVAIARFSKMNEGFPIKRFKADWVISWMLENFPPVAQKQGDN